MKQFIIGGVEIKPGERKKINLDMGRIYDFTPIKIPVEVIRGKKKGPILFISSTIHGDEINGIEIVKKLVGCRALKNICGTLIAIPIVNVFGFNDRSRYLPDRRDLNRSFPGLPNGSLASQLAYKFMVEIVRKCDYGIDLHTGAFHRKNYPQIRANINDPRTLKLAKAFGAPVVINSNLRDGSLREAVSEINIPMLLYEGGEALRFDENVISKGVKGILSFMVEIGMIKNDRYKLNEELVFIAKSSHWIRASTGGVYIPHKTLGKAVKRNDILGEISNPFGEDKIIIRAVEDGIIIGQSLLPLVNRGDAIFHIATTSESKKSEDTAQLYDNLEYIDIVNSSRSQNTSS